MCTHTYTYIYAYSGMLPFYIQAILAWAAVTNYDRLGGFNNNLFPTVLAPEKSKIKVLADSVSGKGLLLVCRQMPSLFILA